MKNKDTAILATGKQRIESVVCRFT